jgi:hypothetical protein
MPRRPKESTSRSALAASGAFLDLADAAVGHRVMTPSEVVDAVTTIVHNVKPLQGYQQDEVVQFVADRLQVVIHAGFDASDLDPDRAERQRTAVDELVGLPFDDVAADPKAVADALAVRVRGEVTGPTEGDDDA